MMDRLIIWVGVGIFTGWTIAILVNYNIYQHATVQLTFLHPVADAVLFMALMLGIYIFIWRTFKRNQSYATIQLGVLAVLSLVSALILA